MKRQTKISGFEVIKYLSSVSASSAANSASALAIYWFVLKSSGEVSMLVLAGVLQSLPAIFAVVISAFANKKGSKFLMVYSDLIRAVLFLIIAIACTTRFGIWLAIIINIVIQVFEQLRTAATTTIIPDIAGSSYKFGTWVGLSNSITAAFELIGVSVSGVVFDAFGYQTLFTMISFIFMISSILAMFLKINVVVNEDSSDFDMMQTFRHILSSKLLVGIILLAIAVNISFAPLDVILTAFVNDVLKMGATVYGFVDSGLMAGMILGSTLFSILAGKWRVKPIAIVGFLACSFVLFSFIFIKSWQLTIVTVFLLGTLMAFIDSAMDSWLLEIVPENGRVAIFTTVTSLFTIAAPLGTSLFGYVYHAVGVSLAFGLMALVILVGVFFSLRIQED